MQLVAKGHGSFRPLALNADAAVIAKKHRTKLRKM
jgi:hypothetical protein